MGTMSFLVPASLPAPLRPHLTQCHLTDTNDFSPVPSRRDATEHSFDLAKDENESGCVAWAWPLSDFGRPLIRSATLRERTEPYHLLVELTRGKLNQLRNQLAAWEGIGLSLDPEDRVELGEAVRRLARIVTDAATAASYDPVEDVLVRTLQLGDRFTRLFADQLLFTRFSEHGQVPTRLGARLAALPPPEARETVRQAFTALRLVPDWKAIEPVESDYHWAELDELVEWAGETGLPTTIGPLIDLDSDRVPAWMATWHGDLPSLAAFICDFVETLVRRYQSRDFVSWEVLGGFNHADALGLGEDDRLRLAARVLDSARQTHAEGRWSVGLAQPWGDYLVSEDSTYSPFIFADTLIRAGYRLWSINLDLRSGPGPTRDPLEVHRLLELFGSIGVPLEVTMGGAGEPHDGEKKWATTSLVMSAAMPQVQTVHWSLEAPADPSAANPVRAAMEAADVAATFAELRSFLG